MTPSPIEPAAPNGNPGPDTREGQAISGGGPADGLSPQVLFRQWLQAEVRSQLDGTEIEIEDIAHHQYREAYFFKRGTEAVRIDIGYKGNWTISGISCPRPSAFAEAVMTHLSALTGQKPRTGELRVARDSAPDRPFLKDFHDRLVPALIQKGINVIDLKEQAWSQRYVLARGPDSVTVDIFYNGKDQLTKFMPVNPSQSPTASLVDLQNDVGSVLIMEVHP